MWLMPKAAAPSIKSACRPRRLRSRQVNGTIGSMPACLNMILTARLDMCTVADWLSVTL